MSVRERRRLALEPIRDLPSLEKLDLRWNDVGPLPDWLQGRAQDGCTVYF